MRVSYPGVDEKFEETVRNLGMNGMFVAVETPMPPGTLLHFELRPSPEWRRLRGRGRVLWARHEPSSDGEPPGIGVRFVELEERCQKAIRWLVETHQQVGDKPFETWATPASFGRLVSKPGKPVPERPRAAPQDPVVDDAPRAGSPLWPWLAATAIGLLALVWLITR